MNQSSDVAGTVLGLAIVLVFMAVGFFLSSFLSGWRGLASQFKTNRPMPAGSFLLYQATFRYWLPYRYLLTVGATPEGFYLNFWPRIGHPRLMIPWSEIEILKPTGFAIFKYQTMRLGQRQRVSFFLLATHVSRLAQIAGMQTAVQVSAPPPPPPSPYAPPPVVEQADRGRVGLGPEYKG